MSVAKSVATWLLVCCYLGLGTGTLQRLHAAEHELEDAREDAAIHACCAHTAAHHHDEHNCPTHADLLLAFFFDGVAGVPLLPGDLVSPAVPCHVTHSARLIWMRIDCRGPPHPLHFI